MRCLAVLGAVLPLYQACTIAGSLHDSPDAFECSGVASDPLLLIRGRSSGTRIGEASGATSMQHSYVADGDHIIRIAMRARAIARQGFFIFRLVRSEPEAPV
jgi:hypothetical protein